MFVCTCEDVPVFTELQKLIPVGTSVMIRLALPSVLSECSVWTRSSHTELSVIIRCHVEIVEAIRLQQTLLQNHLRSYKVNHINNHFTLLCLCVCFLKSYLMLYHYITTNKHHPLYQPSLNTVISKPQACLPASDWLNTPDPGDQQCVG